MLEIKNFINRKQMIKLTIYFKRSWCTFAIEIEIRIFLFNGSKVIYLEHILRPERCVAFVTDMRLHFRICGRHMFPRTKATQKRI